MAGTLLLGSRRYSSWSLRAWLAVNLAGLQVEDHVIPLKGQGRTSEIHKISPNKMVPYLQHDGSHVWESLAICEYAAEYMPMLWPKEQSARAHARSISAQMHAGFRSIRQTCPMDLERKPKALSDISVELEADIALLNTTLEGALLRSGVATLYLFGSEFTIPDCMYAPVALRIYEYRLPVSDVVKAWVRNVLQHHLIGIWCELAHKEPEDWRLFYS